MGKNSTKEGGLSTDDGVNTMTRLQIGSSVWSGSRINTGGVLKCQVRDSVVRYGSETSLFLFHLVWKGRTVTSSPSILRHTTHVFGGGPSRLRKDRRVTGTSTSLYLIFFSHIL